MNPSDARPASLPRITSADWDEVRFSFRDSLLANTSIAALADNIDGCHWPKKGADEIPASYLGLTHKEALARLASRNLSPAHLDKLADILRRTLAFDESFGEMAGVAGRAEADHDPIKRNLARLCIPEDFPTALCNFSAGTHEVCRQERLEVLADFLTFARGAAQFIVISGDFRALLNACVHIDESVLAQHLPYRSKTPGLYLLEGLAHVVRGLDADRRALLRKDPSAALSPEARAQADGLVRHFYSQTSVMLEEHRAGTPASRLVAPLDDPAIESDVAALLTLYLPTAPTATSAPVASRESAPDQTAEKPGFFKRIFGRG